MKGINENVLIGSSHLFEAVGLLRVTIPLLASRAAKAAGKGILELSWSNSQYTVSKRFSVSTLDI